MIQDRMGQDMAIQDMIGQDRVWSGKVVFG